MHRLFRPETTSDKGLVELAQDRTAPKGMLFHHAAEGKPLATPWQVASLRAALLATYSLPDGYIVDCACGSGVQLAAYATTLRRAVLGVELDEGRARASAVNLKTVVDHHRASASDWYRSSIILSGDGTDPKGVFSILEEAASIASSPLLPPPPPPPFFFSLSLSLPALPCLSDLISNANNNQQPTKSGPLVVDEYIGRKVERWWPDDGGWVSGAISDYNAVTGEHCIVYELGTADESWEWYNVRNASNAQCRMVEGAKVDLLAMTKAPGAMNTGGFDTVETLEGLEQARQKLLSRKEEIEQQLAQLEDSDSDNITYSDSDPE